LFVVHDLCRQDHHGDDESDPGADEDTTEGVESDSLAIIQDWALRPQGRVPEPSSQPSSVSYWLAGSSPALQRFKVSVFLKLEDDFRYLVMEVTALLDGDGVRLLGKWFSNLGEVTVLVILILHFTRVVDEGELSCEIAENSLESFF